MTKNKIVLLLNMGGPNNIDEVKVFLKNMFYDPFILRVNNKFLRNILANIIVMMRKNTAINNYNQIGGKSPINDITQKLVDRLNLKNIATFDYAMSYTPKFIGDVLNQYHNLKEITLLPLYPHYSKTTVQSSIQSVENAIKKLALQDISLQIIKPFFAEIEYNNIIIKLIKDKITNFTPNEIKNIDLIISAHSLPQSHIKHGDIYEKDINSHTKIIKDLLQQNNIFFKNVTLAYQSRLGPVKWLEPNITDVLKNINSKRVLILPISFCIDNSETIFELGIEYKKLAKQLNFDFFDIVKCPNDSDAFVDFIINLIRGAHAK